MSSVAFIYIIVGHGGFPPLASGRQGDSQKTLIYTTLFDHYALIVVIS